jgi:hypothetical protein
MTMDVLPKRTVAAGTLAEVLLKQIEERWPTAAALWDRWCSREALGHLHAQDLCDILYTLYFLDWPRRPSAAGISAFCARLADFRPKARLFGKGETPLDVHGTAYVLGALALLAQDQPGLLERVLHQRGWVADDLVRRATALPRWPARWSHHGWRVGHWIGGACAICAILEARIPELYRANGFPPSVTVLERTDELIDLSTGFLRCYGSGRSAALAHRAFNSLYALRHNPICGEIGGVVHVHWANHFLGRPIKGANPLYLAAVRQLLSRQPFMERVPYCLDFDLIQITRIIHEGRGKPLTPELRQRLLNYERALVYFLRRPLPVDYSLHKIAGSLAALHECLLFLKGSRDGLDSDAHRLPPPRDIMREVTWL